MGALTNWGKQMNIVTLKEAEKNLSRLIDQVIDDVDPVIIATEKGQQIVMVSLEEYNAWQETAYLLSSPANAEHLRHSIAEAKQGQHFGRKLIEG